MRVALIADIHGNLAALEAVLEAIAAERPDRIVCLGDVAATGPQPRETLERIAALGPPTVMGNTDAALLDPGADDRGDEIAEIDRWCAAQLDDGHRAFIGSFQPTVALDLGPVGRLLACHGSPASFDDVITATTPDDDLDRLLAGHQAAFVAGGHWHVRLLRSHRGTTILNPGSVGLAYAFDPDGSVRVPPWAEFALLAVEASGEAAVTFRRVPFDQAATLRAMQERGMPHADWWAEG